MRKRTVRCSHCFQSGHNKSSCPEYKKRIESLRDLYGDDDARVRAYDDKKSRKRAAAKTRKCTYCGEPGHNRAGCAKLKASMEAYRSRNVVYRANVIATMAQYGIGLGTLINTTDYWGDDKTFMVVGIDWDQINMSTPNGNWIKVKNIRELPSNYVGRLSLASSITGTNYGSDWSVAVEASAERIRASAPAEFLDGSLGLKSLFKDKNNTFHTMRDHWGDYVDNFDVEKYSTSVYRG